MALHCQTVPVSLAAVNALSRESAANVACSRRAEMTSCRKVLSSDRVNGQESVLSTQPQQVRAKVRHLRTSHKRVRALRRP